MEHTGIERLHFLGNSFYEGQENFSRQEEREWTAPPSGLWRRELEKRRAGEA